MSASGKSSNRLREYYEGYFANRGNSPAALQGKADRKKRKAEEEQKSAKTRNEQLWLMRRRSR